MRTWRWCSWGLVLVAACGSGSGQNGSILPDDGGAEGGATGGDDGGAGSQADAGGTSGDDGGTRATSCGLTPPYVGFATTVSYVRMDNTIHPLEGGKVGFTRCPGFELTTDANGAASTQMTKAMTYSPFYSGTGMISAVGAEVPANVDVVTTPLLVAANASAVVPGYDGNKPTIAIEIVAEGTAPCDAVDGVTLAVTAHPEATVSYMSTSWPLDATPASTTASVGPRAFINGVTGASSVAVTGTKTGCQVKLVTASQTGQFVLLNGSLTVGRATVTN